MSRAKLAGVLAVGQGLREMNGQLNGNRYYCYYGPLSFWRDGRAMGCRELAA